MTGLFALVVVISVSYVIVSVATVLLSLTGMNEEIARFEALSAFSGTGFTTRNADLIVVHPTRRRIATGLMILGNAGTASLVASLIGTFNTGSWVELLFNVLLLVMFAVAASSLVPPGGGDALGQEELLMVKEGYGLVRVQVREGSRLVGVSLRDAGLRAWHLEVLAIEDERSTQPVPEPDWTFDAGQWVLVYGALANVDAAFGEPA